MLGFDAEERLILKLPEEFAGKVVWGSRYPHHHATSARDALARLWAADVPEPLIAQMMGGNAVVQFDVARLSEPIMRG
jgi:predicted TIM-barrel fold metal-dependent hydrolase